MAEDGLFVGATFSAYIELQKAVEDYQRKHNVQFYKRSSRGIQSFKTHYRSNSKLNIPTELKYPEIDYACIHGGQKFKSSASQRLNQR